MIRTDFVIKTVNFERIESKMDKLEDIPLIHIKEVIISKFGATPRSSNRRFLFFCHKKIQTAYLWQLK